MLVVVPHVEADAVQRTVVRVRFLTVTENEVLLNPPRAEWMKADGKHGRREQVFLRSPSERSDERGDGHRLRRDVDERPSVDHRDAMQAPRTHDAEHDRKEREPRRLARLGVAHDARLVHAWQVGVPFELAHVAMMQQMVLAESHRCRKDERDVRDERDDAVRQATAEDEVVRAFVNQDPQRVIDGRTDAVRKRQPHPPLRPTERDRGHNLRRRERHDPQRRRGDRSRQRADVGMRCENLSPPRHMRVGIRDGNEIRRGHSLQFVSVSYTRTPADLAGWNPDTELGQPGEFPFTRGIQPTMYRGRLWTMRQYAGFATAEESNKRYRYLLANGVSGLSVAFDLPTQMGYDSDHPLAAGEVGRVGVAIDSIDDMTRLFDQIPLDRVSTSMTINATAIILLSLYVAVAKRQGADVTK